MVSPISSRTVEFQPDDIIEGRYRIIRKLADGGMGTVFLAEHVLIKRRVALKLLHAELAADGAMVKRFMNEAAAAGMLGHPNIVESTDMGFTGEGVPYIVFEYLEGCLLTEEVYRLAGLPVRRALQIASQIASALEAAHDAQIAHLDLKSDNVFLVRRDESLDHVKVLDFGISRFMAADIEKTQRGILMGTPEFMAPEQITMPDLVDGRADIYALGVLLYEMLTARRPYVNDDPRVLLHRIVHEPPPPLGRRVPASLEHLLFDKMLAKSRDQRIQTMREVKTILDEIAFTVRPELPEASPNAFDEPSRAIEVAYVPPAARPQRRPQLWWPLTAVFAGVAGGVLWYAERQQASSIGGDGPLGLRGASLALGAALLAVYALGWLVFGVRAEPKVVHRSYMKRHGWLRFDRWLRLDRWPRLDRGGPQRPAMGRQRR
jgi:eukaryotic-like serine/threonine-protein kinase